MPIRITTAGPAPLRLRGTGTWRAPLVGAMLALFAATLSPTDATAGERGKKATAAAAKTGGKKGKKQKALINMVESVSFPHEEVQTHALVTVPKFPEAPPPASLKPAGAKGRGRGAAAQPRVVDAQPGVIHEPAPAPPPPAPVRPAAPAAPVRPAAAEQGLRPHDVAPETGKSIDAIVAKAFVAPGPAAAAPAESAPAPTGSAAPNTDEIAAAMKPVRAEIKSACTFGQRGSITVRIEVASDGHVANVTPEGPLAQQPAAACVLDAVRRTRFPASAGASFRYPFSVR
jgi:hypothetical protein